MISFVVAGGCGAVINWALATYFPSQFEHLIDEIFVQPVAAVKTVAPAVFGFFGGTIVLLLWHFIKVRMVRYLLQYDGWFLHPKRQINKIWLLLVVALLGRKNKGSLNYQDYLPSYPLPPLKDTCKKYVQCVKPLLNEEELADTEKAVDKFLKKDGLKIQVILRLRTTFCPKGPSSPLLTASPSPSSFSPLSRLHLLHRQLRSRNWLSDWWLDYIYLKQRSPISFNSNYFATGSALLPTTSQLDRAAMLIYSNVVFYLDMKNGKIENPRVRNLVPFCMDEYRYLHATMREPGEDIDRLVNYSTTPGATLPSHIVVLRRGKFFKFDVMSADGEVQTPYGIRCCLEQIMDMAGEENDERGVSSFTALPRDKWAKIYQQLKEKEINRATLEAIGSSITVLALETEWTDSTNVEEQARALFHGNTLNRWFDKCVTVSVASSAVVGVNVEHSGIDATVGSQLWEYVLTDEEYDESGHVLEPFRGQRCFEVDPPTHLKWDLEGLEEELEHSKNNLRQMIQDSDLVLIKTYGKGVPKKCRLSPDGWFQMAMQLAHYRKHKEIVLTYESATTRLYYKGRTETIRPVTEKSVEFCKAFDDPSVSPEYVKKTLKEAIELQFKHKMEAMRGLGVDRHLFGLYCVARGTNTDPLPDIFNDKAFNLKFLLSTSQTPVRTTDRWREEVSSLAGGFGTVFDDGYGVSYLVYEDYVTWSVHSKRSSSRTDSKQFAEHLSRAMEDMRKLYNA